MFSFFDDKPGGSTSGPLVSKAKVKPKPSPNPRAPTTGTSTPTSGRTSTSTSNSNGHATPRNTLKVPRPDVGRQGSSSGIPSQKGKISSTSSSTPSRPSNGTASSKYKKRKVESRIESESESNSSDGGDAIPEKRKGGRGGASRDNTAGLGDVFGSGSGDADAGRSWGSWDLGVVDERGEWGRGWTGFVSSEEALRGRVGGWAGGEKSGGGLEKYVAYFPQPGFEKESMPSVELLYPAAGCREKFVLLTPTSAREYSPIAELRNALRIILAHYIPPSHQGIFGNLSDSLDIDTPSNLPTPTQYTASPRPGSSTSTPPPDGSGTASPAREGPTETIGDALRKALAPNRRDGPALLRAMQRYNAAMAELQVDPANGPMGRYLAERSGTLTRQEWSKVVEVVHEQAYSRVVGPYSNELEHHPKHSEEVLRAISAKEDAYGELRHSFVSKVIEQTGLGPDSVFVDLGSGVGNCVMQVALEAGSKSYGFELLPVPAHCARLQLRETQRRWAMWGLKGNLAVDVFEGDFRAHEEVGRRLREADVVLVNNEVFPPSLNVDLTHLFLDLKEGAKIVSLKPFVPESFRLNESNCDSFAAIVSLSQHTYHRDWVSWKGDSGVFYLQVIDRSARMKFEEEMVGGGGRRRR